MVVQWSTDAICKHVSQLPWCEARAALIYANVLHNTFIIGSTLKSNKEVFTLMQIADHMT